MKAKRKQLDTLTPDALGVDVTPRVNVLKYEAPEERQAGRIVESVDELIQVLRNEAKVI
jgi:electron transfer flavoprotein beta subunit